jgi:hypothetical protein
MLAMADAPVQYERVMYHGGKHRFSSQEVGQPGSGNAASKGLESPPHLPFLVFRDVMCARERSLA